MSNDRFFELREPGDIRAAARRIAPHVHRTPVMQTDALVKGRTVAVKLENTQKTGTFMAEWEEQGLAADTVLIAVGGGGLIGGALAWLRGRRKVVAVESEGTATLHTALHDGPDAQIEVSGIAADALGARRIGRACYDMAKAQGVTSVLVTDEAIAEAQSALWSGLRQYVEPAGATALAALRSGAYSPAKDETLAILVCGANPAIAPL